MDYEKIVLKIASIFHQDPLLKTFDVILKFVGDNNTAVLYFEHNLGIESWCIKDLYVHVYNTVFSSNADSPLFESYLRTALLLNPDVLTFWRMRKKLVLDQKLELKSELNFCRVVLLYKPKTIGAFNYRMWLIREVLKGQLDLYSIKEELELIVDVADRYSNNYIVWDYGVWLLNNLPVDLLSNVLITFWKRFQNWVEVHIVDYSALHFRQFLLKKLVSDDVIELTDSSFKKEVILSSQSVLPKMLNINVADMRTLHHELECIEFYPMALIIVELSLNENLILFYENHEALWTHRRYLYHFFLLVSKKLCTVNSQIQNTFISLVNFSEGKCSDLISFLFFQIHEHFIDNFKKVDSDYHLKRCENWLKNYTMLNK